MSRVLVLKMPFLRKIYVFRLGNMNQHFEAHETKSLLATHQGIDIVLYKVISLHIESASNHMK